MDGCSFGLAICKGGISYLRGSERGEWKILDPALRTPGSRPTLPISTLLLGIVLHGQHSTLFCDSKSCFSL